MNLNKKVEKKIISKSKTKKLVKQNDTLTADTINECRVSLCCLNPDE